METVQSDDDALSWFAGTGSHARVEKRRLEAAGARLVSWEDPAYPAQLRNIVDPPLVLAARGTLRRAEPRAIQRGKYEFTLHALDETDEDDLAESDVRGVMRHGRVVATLRDDPRGPRFIVRGSPIPLGPTRTTSAASATNSKAKSSSMARRSIFLGHASRSRRWD